MIRRIVYILAVLALAFTVEAELKLNGLFTDNMVLQRNQKVSVWGTADPGAEITVQFGGQKRTAKAKDGGDWIVHLKSMKASTEPQELFVTSSVGDHAIFVNVLVGDVWLCAGQSNMATTMKRYLIWEKVKGSFSNDQIRMFKIMEGGVGSPKPTKKLVVDPFFKDSWQACTPEFAAEFSATAGFFGLKLQRDTDIPVGLLYANRGGTAVNMWLPREVLESNSDYARFLDKSNPNWTPTERNPDAIRAPSHLYNGTIHPLQPFAIRGAIWYQGESDAQWPELYEDLFSDMIHSWRKAWGYDFPFLFVQLAPYQNVKWDRLNEAWAWLRDAQTRTLKLPNTGMAVIIDAGEAVDIHPQAKNLPGYRLAVLAEKLDNRKFDAGFPTFGKMKIKTGKAFIKFKHVAGGLETRRVALNTTKGFMPGEGPEAVVAEAHELKGFTLCGADKKFVEAQARIVSKDTVEVSSSAVENPVAVRYGWANFPLCNLYGQNGLPAVPFRTDKFPMPNFSGEKRGEPITKDDSGWGSSMEIVEAEDGPFVAAKIDGRDGWSARANQKGSNMLYFRVGPEQQNGKTPKIGLTVVYLDRGYANIQLRYDSSDPQCFVGKKNPGAWKPLENIVCRNTGGWRAATYEIDDASFANRCNGADLRLQVDRHTDLTLGGVYILPRN